jgi:hypothetical protein
MWVKYGTAKKNSLDTISIISMLHVILLILHQSEIPILHQVMECQLWDIMEKKIQFFTRSWNVSCGILWKKKSNSSPDPGMRVMGYLREKSG